MGRLEDSLQFENPKEPRKGLAKRALVKQKTLLEAETPESLNPKPPQNS